MLKPYQISGPVDENLEIPVSTDPISDPYVGLDLKGQKQYYDDNGYVVLRNLLNAERCDEIVNAFKGTVKTYNGLMYRQTSTGLAEPHRFTESGFLLNSILNPHDLNCAQFGEFRHKLINVFSDPKLQVPVKNILQAQPTLVQSMYFEGNPATWAHQDTYYLDSSPLGGLAATWIALEDIHPGAGRFYVYPGSHKLSLPKNTKELNFSQNHEQYKEHVKETIKREGLQCRAPALAKGDVLVWNSFTIHGSLKTTEPSRSRNSLTAHYIPAHVNFLAFQAKTVHLQTALHNGMAIHHPKDQDRLKYKLLLGAERTFPRPFRYARSYAIKHFTR
jgi:phytanoyl-CoA hydroxylase